MASELGMSQWSMCNIVLVKLKYMSYKLQKCDVLSEVNKRRRNWKLSEAAASPCWRPSYFLHFLWWKIFHHRESPQSSKRWSGCTDIVSGSGGLVTRKAHLEMMCDHERRKGAIDLHVFRSQYQLANISGGCSEEASHFVAQLAFWKRTVRVPAVTEHLLTRVELCRSVVETTWPTSSLQNIVHGTLLISTRPSSHLGGSGKERMLYQTQQLGFFNAVLIKAWVETDDCLRRAVDAFPKCLRICILQKDEQVGHL